MPPVNGRYVKKRIKINMLHGKFSCSGNLVKGEDILIIACGPKAFVYSMLKSPDSLIQELREWKLACPVSEYDLVFPSPEGKMSQHDNVIKRYFNQALREAKLCHVSLHSLRHTNASMRIAAGQNIKYIQTQLGHASINITLDIYGHLFNDSNFNKQQVELLEQSFKSVRKPLEKPVKKEVVVSVNPSSIKPLQVEANA